MPKIILKKSRYKKSTTLTQLYGEQLSSVTSNIIITYLPEEKEMAIIMELYLHKSIPY
jgi:hypothetical protein